VKNFDIPSSEGIIVSDAVVLVRSSSRTLREVGRELGVNHETLHGWLNAAKRAEHDTAGGQGGELSAVEREELRRLRNKGRRAVAGEEILRKAVQYLRKRWVDDPPLPVHLCMANVAAGSINDLLRVTMKRLKNMQYQLPWPTASWPLPVSPRRRGAETLAPKSVKVAASLP
jgi:transposase